MEMEKKKLVCRKCGMELHPDQKVCIRCGQPTPKGGGFDYGPEKEPWRPSPAMMYAAGGVVLLLVILIVMNALRVDPPEKVAKVWFDALANRKPSVAGRYVTPDCQQDLQTRFSDLQAVSDNYYTFITENSATYTIGKPKLNSQSKPTRAAVTITMKSSSGDAQVDLEMVKVGRKWLVDKIISSV